MDETTELAERDLRARGGEVDAAQDGGDETGETSAVADLTSEGKAESGTEKASGEHEVPQGAEAPTLAELAAQRVAAARQMAAEAEQERFHQAWWENVRQEVEANPELKDEKSALGQALQQVLRETPLYSLTPDGFRHAAALARARQTAHGMPDLQARVAALEKENARLVGLTSVSGSGPARLRSEGAKDFSERDLRRMAAELDAH